MWFTNLPFDPYLWPTDLIINRDHLLIKDYLPTKVWSFWGKAFMSYLLHKVWLMDMTFDLDLWPTDLNIDRVHLLIKYYLRTKFETSGAKRPWVISRTRLGRQTWSLTLTYDLLTWISIGIIYSFSTVCVPSLKFLGKVFLSNQLHKVKENRHTDWPTDRHGQSNIPLLPLNRA